VVCLIYALAARGRPAQLAICTIHQCERVRQPKVAAPCTHVGCACVRPKGMQGLWQAAALPVEPQAWQAGCVLGLHGKCTHCMQQPVWSLLWSSLAGVTVRLLERYWGWMRLTARIIWNLSLRVVHNFASISPPCCDGVARQPTAWSRHLLAGEPRLLSGPPPPTNELYVLRAQRCTLSCLWGLRD
jgi:hypothetical protein